MFPTISAIQRFLASEDGPTSVEYAVMLATIVAVCLLAISSVGTSTFGSLDNSSQAMQAAGLGQ